MYSGKQSEIDSLDKQLYDKKDIILTLGAGLDERGDLKPNCKDRIERSFELFEKGCSNRMVMSTKDEAPLMKDYVISKYGVRKDQVLTEDRSLYTATNLVFTARDVMSPKNLNSLYIVSNFWHIPRVYILAKCLLGDDYDWETNSASDRRPLVEFVQDAKSESVKIERDSDFRFVSKVKKLFERDDDFQYQNEN